MDPKIILLFALVGIAIASYPQHGGHSNSFRKQDDHGNYAFGYDIVDPIGAKNFRKESGDGWGNKHGSYGLHDVDGRLRIVDYVADGHGFRAKIRTNEPGTTNKDAASAIYNGPDPHGHSHSEIPSGHVGNHHNAGYHGGLHGAHGHAYPLHHGGPHSAHGSHGNHIAHGGHFLHSGHGPHGSHGSHANHIGHDSHSIHHGHGGYGHGGYGHGGPYNHGGPVHGGPYHG